MTDTLTFPVDPEHIGLRAALLVVGVVGTVLGYVGLSALVSAASGFNLIALFGGLLIGFGAAFAAEHFLRTRWKSGRAAELDTQGARLSRRGKVQCAIHSGEPANLLTWRFEVKRGRRVQKGWFVVACALEQEDTYLAVYTIVSPAQFEALRDHQRYILLLPDSDKAVEKDLRLAGQMRRLRLAEEHRWHDGAEMTFADFDTFVQKVHSDFPAWQNV